MIITSEGQDPLQIAVASAQDTIESLDRYIVAAQALESYISSLCTVLFSDCTNTEGEYAVAVTDDTIRFRSSVGAEWETSRGVPILSADATTWQLIFLQVGNRLKAPGDQPVDVTLVKVFPCLITPAVKQYIIPCSVITLPSRHEAVYIGDGQFEIKTSYGTFLEYWCSVFNECDEAKLGTYWEWFIDPAHRLNQTQLTGMSDDALAALIYQRVWDESMWWRTGFRPQRDSDINMLEADYRGLRALYNSISDRLALGFLREIWNLKDRKNQSRTRGISLGLPNLYPLQALDAEEWWRYFVEYQAIHGISGVQFEDFRGREHINPSPIMGSHDVYDVRVYSSMIENQASIEWYSLIVLWAAWRYSLGDLRAAGISGSFDIEAIYLDPNAPKPIPPDEMSVFGIQATVNTDTNNFLTSKADRHEIEKAVRAVEQLQQRGRELGFDIEVGIDFNSYTAEEARWLVEDMQIWDPEQFPLLQQVYCDHYPNCDRCKN